MGKPVLLWTNTNPASNFTSGSINVALADYDYFAVQVRRLTEDNRETGIYTFQVHDYPNKYLNMCVAEMCYRTMALNSSRTQITFSDCYKNDLNGTIVIDNKYLLPIKIWGIK